MTIAKRNKNVPQKKKSEKIRKQRPNKSEFIKQTFNVRKIELEDEYITD